MLFCSWHTFIQYVLPCDLFVVDCVIYCHSLTHSLFTAVLPVRNILFGEGSSTSAIVLDDLDCSGGEANLLECDSGRGPGSHDCDHSEDAGVICGGGGVAHMCIIYTHHQCVV